MDFKLYSILKKVYSYIISPRAMGLLLIAFAASMAVGTFLDAGQETSPTPYSRTLVYNALWFELIIVLLAINFIGNIRNHRLIENKKWTILILHLSFIIIIIGAGVTRYFGFEGVLPIYEGEKNNKILSENVYMSAWIDGEMNGQLMRKKIEKKLLLSERISNDFNLKTSFNKTPIRIEYLKFYANANESINFIEDINDSNHLHLVESSEEVRKDHYIKAGESILINDKLISFQNSNSNASIHFFLEKDSLKLKSNHKGTIYKMSNQQQSFITKDSISSVKLLSLYTIEGVDFVIPELPKKGNTQKVIEQTESSITDALQVKIKVKGREEIVTLYGGQGIVNAPKTISFDELDIHLSYGSKEIELPFYVKLNNLISEKYPGADPNKYGVGYKSYESQVSIINNDSTRFDSKIFMNNILDHKGYRFFQSGIDFSSNKKRTKNNPDITVLSVNKDFLGTAITYLGYSLLYLGLILVMFDKKTRFKYLEKIVNKQKGKKILLLLLFLASFSSVIGQEHKTTHYGLNKRKVDSIIKSRAIPKDEAAKFGQLILQDLDGRMKPINTYASELLRKIHGKETYASLDANQVFLSIIQNPKIWIDAPIIKLKRGNDSIRRLLSIPKKEMYISLSGFFTPNGKPKISRALLQDAFTTNTPNQFQKDLKKAYEAQRVVGQSLSGDLVKIFPIPFNKENKWASYNELHNVDFGTDSEVIKKLFPMGYFDAINRQDFTFANNILKSIEQLQSSYGKEIIPTKKEIQLEILYNKWDVFKKLYVGYLFAGLLLFIMVITRIFIQKKVIKHIITTLKLIILVMFTFHIIGLVARWYISGHAPWSDAYESMIYVAFATMLFGILFGRKSDLTFASSTFVSAIILMIAHWNWMDPSISNLEPVLDSYWLMVHVAVIVASYGPFTISAVLGIISLLLMLLTTKKNKVKMKIFVKETQAITEMAITIGIIMLTIGNFLGGQWANESWGRYWGWDPKETWALISIIIYAFVLHMRLIPGLRSNWLFSFVSILAYGSILMTYFGVNFWLVGLHSYASGDQIFSLKIIAISLGILTIYGALSYFVGYKRHYTSKP